MENARPPWLDDALRRAAAPLRGYHHDNRIVENDGARYVLRVPIGGAPAFDLRAIPEHETLALVERIGLPAPRVVARDPAGAWELHTFVNGTLLNDVHPWATRVPEWVPTACAHTLRALHAADATPLAHHTRALARSPDAPSLHRALLAFARTLHARLRDAEPALYARLEIPDEPYAGLEADAEKLAPRPFALCHVDAHRKNIVLRPHARDIALLDWELALVADPAYDLAVHLHRMRYAADQEEAFLRAYGADDALRRQVLPYLRLERVKSAVGDLARYADELRAPPSARRALLAEHYARKLAHARGVWGQRAVAGADEVIEAAGRAA